MHILCRFWYVLARNAVNIPTHVCVCIIRAACILKTMRWKWERNGDGIRCLCRCARDCLLVCTLHLHIKFNSKKSLKSLCKCALWLWSNNNYKFHLISSFGSGDNAFYRSWLQQTLSHWDNICIISCHYMLLCPFAPQTVVDSASHSPRRSE